MRREREGGGGGREARCREQGEGSKVYVYREFLQFHCSILITMGRNLND
jgi:hypothetical protein